MTLVPEVPRVDVEADDAALDVRIDPAPPGTGPDRSGIALLADAVLHARSDTVATVRVHGPDGFHYAVLVSRGAAVELVHLEPDGDSYAARIAVSADERVHLSIVASDFESGMAALEARVAEGGMGAGGGEETHAEPPEAGLQAPPAPGAEPEFGSIGGGGLGPLGGGFGGRDLGLVAPDDVELPTAAGPEAPPEADEVEADEEEEEADGGPGPAPRPGDLDGSTPIDAHVAASMPADVFEDVPFLLTVTLSREAVKIGRGQAGDDQQVTLRSRGGIRIAVQANGFEVAAGTPSEVDARIPAPGKPKEYPFQLVPGDEGVGRVTVTVTQRPDPTPVAVITLSTMILPAGDAPDAEAADGPTLQGFADAAAPPAELKKLPTIAIEETISRGDSVLKVTAKVAGRKPATNTVRLPGKAAYVDGLYAQLAAIRAAYVKATKEDHIDEEIAVGAAEDALRELGTGIADTLFGDEVNALLWSRRKKLAQLVIQTSGELDIPWEIVHLVRVGDAEPDDASHFLGDKGVTRRLWGTRQPTDLRVATTRVLAIAPEYDDQNLFLQGTQDEVKSLHDALKITAPTAIVTRDDVRTHIAGGFDLLHFAGHGRWRDADPRGQEIALAGYVEGADDLSAAYTDADAREDLLRLADARSAASSPFVFLSACDVGRLQRGATGLGGFAEVFLRAGAGVFIGCSWAVRDDVTALFAQTLYDQLITRRKPLGEAAAAARSATRAAHDLTALAFTVFADPRARISVLT